METNQKQLIATHPFAENFIRIKAKQLCRRTDVSRSDLDDLQQDMRLYLLEKSHLFDPERGNVESFITQTINTWAAMRVRYLEREKRRDLHKATSLEGTTVECDGALTSLGNSLVEDEGDRLTRVERISSLEQFELREGIEHAMKNLSADDRALLASVVEHGARATAQRLGVSYRQVNKAMARIRQAFEKSGLGRD